MWPGAGGGNDNDLFGEDGANMEQQGNEPRFPTLAVARSNDMPQLEFIELPIKMLYLNVKLNHNMPPSLEGGAQARKYRMYVASVILIFDLFATDAELDSFRQVSGYKNRLCSPPSSPMSLARCHRTCRRKPGGVQCRCSSSRPSTPS